MYILEGEVVLVTGAGEECLRAGDCAGFKAGDPDGAENRTNAEVVLAIGSRNPEGDGLIISRHRSSSRAGARAFTRTARRIRRDRMQRAAAALTR